MDRNTIIGLILVGAVIFGFSWFNSRQAAEYNRQQQIADSIARAEGRLIDEPFPVEHFEQERQQTVSANTAAADSIRAARYGASLLSAESGAEQLYTIENKVVKLTISNRGGKIVGAELKDYKTYYGDPLQLYAEGSAKFDLTFFIRNQYNDTRINTADYFFETDEALSTLVTEGDRRFVMRLPVDTASWVEYAYTIPADDYMISYQIKFVNMDHLLSNQGAMQLEWESVARQNEKGFDNENKYTTVAYKFPGDDGIDNLGISENSKETLVKNSIRWVGFKQQFFSNILIAEGNFNNASLRYDTFAPEHENIKHFRAELSIPVNRYDPTYDFKMFMGPNKYSVLKGYDEGMERLIPLGWSIVRWVNKWIVIPVFEFLDNRIANYGIIILLLTLLIKIIILPLTYKSYLSMAKMRVLKPEIDAIGQKYPDKEDAMKKNQATMELYKKAGVSPLGGCFPLLIQFPFIVALFYFFPSSIELRGESFLWADDLSSYDSILNLPFKIPFYGDHVSLFTLLMSVSLIVTSKMNSQASAAGAQMASMKFITWFMPVMFLFIFNNFASGLTYYYFVSSLIGIAQTFIMRSIVNDDKLHARLMANASKNSGKKKSKFQQRYEDMVKAQQQQQKIPQKGKKK